MGRLPFPAELMDRSPDAGQHQAIRMLTTPGQGEGFVAPLQGPAWIAEVPEDQAAATMEHPGVSPWTS